MGDDSRMKTLEQRLRTIEQIAEDLEQGGLAIDEAIERYAQAIELVLECRTSLADLEQRIVQARSRTRSAGPAPGEDSL